MERPAIHKESSKTINHQCTQSSSTDTQASAQLSPFQSNHCRAVDLAVPNQSDAPKSPAKLRSYCHDLRVKLTAAASTNLGSPPFQTVAAISSAPASISFPARCQISSKKPSPEYLAVDVALSAAAHPPPLPSPSATSPLPCWALCKSTVISLLSQIAIAQPRSRRSSVHSYFSLSAVVFPASQTATPLLQLHITTPHPMPVLTASAHPRRASLCHVAAATTLLCLASFKLPLPHHHHL
ncbi:hypothetical protein M0R45_001974 [Rubus argutus]|uniref:Uncharacterized protein n=1 Tax=Rubus argutus TaxID=59490 RepID=A0AAW1VEP1_RUBAR